jgi:hypothetical protein
MKKKFTAAVLTAGAIFAVAGYALATGSGFKEVDAWTYDPGHTHLVNGTWLSGAGCPTNARVFTGTGYTPYTAGGCPTGDSKDKNVQGLLLFKTGPTGNYASAGASLQHVNGIHLSELGYDIRKQAAPGSPVGSHCGAGAPRFDVITTDNVDHFVGCNSPPGAPTAAGDGWTRLRWNAALLAASFPPILPTDTIRSIDIVFDEGQDTAPDFFGAAVLDNIDVNGTIVGQGEEEHGHEGGGHGHGGDQPSNSVFSASTAQFFH